MTEDDSIQVRGDRNAIADELGSVNFNYDEIDRGNPLAAIINEDEVGEAYREASRRQLDFLRRVIMAIQDYRGDKAFAIDCACLALGFHALARAKTQEELAQRHACTKANVNRAVNSIQFAIGIEPLPGQRCKEARGKFSEVRKQQLKPL